MEADMTWISTGLALTAIFLVSLQGVSFFSHAERKISLLAGILNLSLAGGGLIAFFLFRAGALIASPEYGVILVQGTAALLWSCILLVGISVAGAMIWQIALLSRNTGYSPKNAAAEKPQDATDEKKWLNHSRYILLSGLVVGIAAALR